MFFFMCINGYLILSLKSHAAASFAFVFSLYICETGKVKVTGLNRDAKGYISTFMNAVYDQQHVNKINILFPKVGSYQFI